MYKPMHAPEAIAAVLVGREFTPMRPRLDTSPMRVARLVRLPAFKRASAKSDYTSAAYSPERWGDLLLLTYNHSERTLREALKISAIALADYTGELSAAEACRRLTVQLLKAGWKSGMGAAEEAERVVAALQAAHAAKDLPGFPAAA
jgi:hypothetical protein